MIVRISGGIGNQMFQYAFKLMQDKISGNNNFIDIRGYEKQNIHNGYELENVFGVHEQLYTGHELPPSEQFEIIYKIAYVLGVRMISTNRFKMEVLITYDEQISFSKNNLFYFDGYWQSEAYFKSIEKKVRRVFVFPEIIDKQNLEIADMIKQTNSVSLHVRHGDFLKTSKYIDLSSTDYYKNAIKYICSQINTPLFFVMSDDIEWCKQNLLNDKNVVFINWNHGANCFRDMQLMSLCKNNIIANSSFSWWGAWLNTNPDKIVVAPSKFYSGNKRDESHLIPARWTRIGS